MADAPSDLDELDPEPIAVTVRPYDQITRKRSEPETIVVSEFWFGSWPKAIRLFRPVIDAINRAGIAGFNGTGLVFASDWLLRLPQVMEEGGEPLIEFVAFATNKQRSWFDVLGGDDGIALTRAVFEANSSFFVRRIAPMLGVAVQPTPAVPTGSTGGPSSTTNSSDTDTTKTVSSE